MEGEQIFHTADGREEIHDTQSQMTQEEREKNLKKQQEFDHAYSLYLSGMGPDPREKPEARNNVIEFPKPVGENIEKKAA